MRYSLLALDAVQSSSTLWPFKSLQKNEQSGQNDPHSALSVLFIKSLDASADITPLRRHSVLMVGVRKTVLSQKPERLECDSCAQSIETLASAVSGVQMFMHTAAEGSTL